MAGDNGRVPGYVNYGRLKNESKSHLNVLGFPSMAVTAANTPNAPKATVAKIPTRSGLKIKIAIQKDITATTAEIMVVVHRRFSFFSGLLMKIVYIKK